MGLDVPKDELLDPAYEERTVTLQLEDEIASAMPCFYTPRRLDEHGLSADALQNSVIHDDFSLVGEELHEHRINSADMGFGRHDCAGTYDLSYLRSHDDDSPQAVPRSPLHISETGERSCHSYAKMLATGSNSPRDVRQALELFTRSCSAGYAPSCAEANRLRPPRR